MLSGTLKTKIAASATMRPRPRNQTTGGRRAGVDDPIEMAEVVFNPSRAATPALIEAVARAGGDGRHEYRARSLS